MIPAARGQIAGILVLSRSQEWNSRKGLKQ